MCTHARPGWPKAVQSLNTETEMMVLIVSDPSIIPYRMKAAIYCLFMNLNHSSPICHCMVNTETNPFRLERFIKFPENGAFNFIKLFTLSLAPPTASCSYPETPRK